MRFRSDAYSLNHSVTRVNFDREINLFIKFTKLISSRLFLIQTLSRAGYLQTNILSA